MTAPAILRAAQADANKTRLKAIGEEARSRGIFGAPTFFTEDGEMFWGNDRLDQALAWASGERARAGAAHRRVITGRCAATDPWVRTRRRSRPPGRRRAADGSPGSAAAPRRPADTLVKPRKLH